MLISGWSTPINLLEHEIIQSEYEGRLVDEWIKQKAAELHPVYDACNEAKIAPLLAALEHCPTNPAFPYVQPNDLEGIRRERPNGPRQMPVNLSREELLDQLHGAWTGRAVGCALGKPVEAMGLCGRDGHNGRKAIKTYLQGHNAWPLKDFFPYSSADGNFELICKNSCREYIDHMEPDDDIHYSLIGLKVLEQIGQDFKWYHVADTWNSSLPYNAICTAETQAILNYSLSTPRMREGKDTYTTAEFTRRHNNPFREWIGAQIRADGWAYCCAGNPELAAEFAWRDAHWTHTSNGIYGEMFVAAMIAAAFVENDPKKLVEIGLSEIPANCRLAGDIRWAVQTVGECADFESFMERSEKRFEGMHAVHTNNNAVVVAMSLFYGKMNPERSICTSVMGGLDTDCNGATTGSIVGATTGRKGFGGEMADRLNDTIRPLVFGFQQITMKELAERTLAVYEKVKMP